MSDSIIDLRKTDVNYCVRCLPTRLRVQMEMVGPSFVVAGGFLRGTIAREDVSDIDVFGPSLQDVRAFAADLFNGRPTVASDNAVIARLGGRVVQIIHGWTFTTPEQIINHFDFTIARAVLWCGRLNGSASWGGRCDADFYADLAAKRLVYTDPPDKVPAGSMLRAFKFAARGYAIPLDSLARLTAAFASEYAPEVDSSTLESALHESLVRVDPQLDGFTLDDAVEANCDTAKTKAGYRFSFPNNVF